MDRIQSCEHEWVAFSTALAEGWIMVQCIECGRHGTVEDPTEKEWSRAFHAPSQPYQWEDDRRVRLKSQGPLYVVKGTDAWRCKCLSPWDDPPLYERFPQEMVNNSPQISVEEHIELGCLSGIVEDCDDLCSLSFPPFIKSSQKNIGQEHSGAILAVASAIEQWHQKGMHMSPGIVARVLESFGQTNHQKSN